MFGPQEVPLGPIRLQMALPPFGCDPGAYTVRIQGTSNVDANNLLRDRHLLCFHGMSVHELIVVWFLQQVLWWLSCEVAAAPSASK